MGRVVFAWTIFCRYVCIFHLINCWKLVSLPASLSRIPARWFTRLGRGWGQYYAPTRSHFVWHFRENDNLQNTEGGMSSHLHHGHLFSVKLSKTPIQSQNYTESLGTQQPKHTVHSGNVCFSTRQKRNGARRIDGGSGREMGEGSERKGRDVYWQRLSANREFVCSRSNCRLFECSVRVNKYCT